jgi:hypothetical protein
MSSGWVALHLLNSISMADILSCILIQWVSFCATVSSIEMVTSCYESSSRMWVSVHLLSSIWMADILPWIPIQRVSCCAPLALHLNGWHPAMNAHPERELLCTSWAPSEWLISCHEFLSRGWVAVHLLSSIWMADILLWITIQRVSCYAPLELQLNGWHPAMNHHPDGEFPCTFWAPFEQLTSCYESSSIMWVAVHLLISTWMTNPLLWIIFQNVSCYASQGGSGIWIRHGRSDFFFGHCRWTN